ncbi:MAG: hypothetical protein FWF82_07535, partial [Oscillospiraceae bacterium]|nr:hypothetical protein [Oscillospiraceae bacterium]
SVGIGVGGMIFAGVSNSAKSATSDVDELIQRVNSFAGVDLRSELDSQYQRLDMNNSLLAEMNALGGNTAFFTRLNNENQALERNIALNNIKLHHSKLEQSSTAYDTITSNDFSAGTFSWGQEVNTPGFKKGETYTGNRGNFDLPTAVEILLNQDNLSLENEKLLHNYIDIIQEYRGDLYDFIPEHAKTAATIDGILDLYVKKYDVGDITADDRDYETYLKNLEDSLKPPQDIYNLNALKDFTTPFIDLNKVTDDLANAYGALESAQNSLNKEQDIGLQTYYDLMNIQPEYLSVLLDESGTLRDLDEVTKVLTQSKIDEMGISQARAVLQLATTYQTEMGTLAGYASSMDNVKSSTWGAVEATMALIVAQEKKNLLSQMPINPTTGKPIAPEEIPFFGGFIEKAINFQATSNTQGLFNQIQAIQDWTNSVQRNVAENGIPARIDNVNKVNEIGRIRDEITLSDEDLRMLTELASRDYEIKVNLHTVAPVINQNVTNNGETPLFADEIANAVKSVLISQVSAHTDDTYF